MKSAVGKQVRARLFPQVEDVLPGFTRLKDPSFSRELWVWMRRDERLRQWIWYQQDRYEDSFTLELAWSSTVANPFEVHSVWPVPQPFSPAGQRLRLGALFTPNMDYWWWISDPPPALHAVSPEEAAHRWMHPPLYGPEETALRVDRAVSHARHALRAHAAPYFQLAREWAGQCVA